MAETGKRKDAPAGRQQRAKKKKTGNAGKWKTPHQQAKVAAHQDANLQPGDTGIWVTCARHQEGKAAREVGVLFAEYAEKMYGIKSVHDIHADKDEEGGDEDDDLEAAIHKELAALTSKSAGKGSASGPADDCALSAPVKMNVDCLLFVKTRQPVDPVAFVRRICEDAQRCNEIPGLMRCRYVNRLTPVSVMGKATEQGLVEVAREVLARDFDLSGKRSREEGAEPKAAAKSEGEDEEAGAGQSQNGPAEGAAEPKMEAASSEAPSLGPEQRPFTFAIRPTIRNHSNLKRDVVINTIAGLINDDRHKVNLTSPDKVILIDVYQAVCGMSVVDGDWDQLKRFNLTELYSAARNAQTTEHPDNKA